ncbi:MAG: penicillin-binding protein [Candidatus Peregrinibacteria bacterium]|nr:penicillin-binding protein [Candidatus Peregrinibacteria bacterium]
MLKKFIPERFWPRENAEVKQKIIFWGSTAIIGIALISVILFVGIIGILSIGLPDVSDLEKLQADQSTEIYDKDGDLLYTIHGEENREQISYDKISTYLINATVAIEDDRFWEHSGFDVMGIGKAVLYEIFGIGVRRGGSTITQQYVKNSFLSSERSYTRKAKELILSVRLERTYEKEKILELYLNRIPYGNNAYGAGKAAEIYFDKSAKDLTLAESSILASLPQAPTKYNPYGDNKYSHLLKEFTSEETHYRKIESEIDLNQNEYVRGLVGKFVDLGDGQEIYIQGRSDLVLKRMFELGTITEKERKTALNELQAIQFQKHVEKIKHPHFVLYVKQILEEKYGKDVVEKGGLKVYTTLDSSLQDYAEKTAEEIGKKNAETHKTNNAAILAINAKTGQILAMVGSRDYYNEEIDGNVNVVVRPRQPGSSFKPIVYAEAFYNGFAPATPLYDVPLKVGEDRPENYSGNWFGQVTIRRALGQSRNIPAIEAYFLAGQQDPIIDLATKMGITTLNKAHSYGYPLAIGAGEIPLIEMVQAYGTFANNGKKPELISILKVINSNGDVLEEWQQKEFDEVLDPQVAYSINSILSDASNAVSSRLHITGHTNAAKTGTSTKENKKKSGGKTVAPADAWTIGYTPTIVIGVWTGNTDGSGLEYSADGVTTAAPIFNAVMSYALKNIPDEGFPRPEGIKEVAVSSASGKLPGKNTPKSLIITDIFPSFSIPTEVETNSFYKVKIDKVSGLLATEYTPKDAIQEVLYQNYEIPPQLSLFKEDIRKYFASKADNSIKDGGTSVGSIDETSGTKIMIGVPPLEYDNIHTEETAKNPPTISITSPVSQSIISLGDSKNKIVIDIQAAAKNSISEVQFFVDDKQEYSTNLAPYTGYLTFSKFFTPGKHLIVAKVIDRLGYSTSAAIEIKIETPSENTTEPTETPVIPDAIPADTKPSPSPDSSP